MSLVYKLLEAKDVEKFKTVYYQAFKLEPDLENIYPMVAWQGEEIVAFFGLYTILVADSMWVRPDFRNTGVWRKLIDAINKLPWPKGRGYYFFQEDTKPEQGAVCKKMQGEKLSVKIWRKLF